MLLHENRALSWAAHRSATILTFQKSSRPAACVAECTHCSFQTTYTFLLTKLLHTLNIVNSTTSISFIHTYTTLQKIFIM